MRIYAYGAIAIILTSVTLTGLNAATKKGGRAASGSKESEQLFALYNPDCSDCSGVNLRGEELRDLKGKPKALTLTLTRHDKPISAAVRLFGNELFERPLESSSQADLKPFKQFDRAIKLSLAAKLQYYNGSPYVSAHVACHGGYQVGWSTTVYKGIEDPKRSCYINGPFLIIDDISSQHKRLQIDTALDSIPALLAALRRDHARDSRSFNYPLIIVDLRVYLTMLFGADWAYKLPVYRDPLTGATDTQAEIDARHPY
jgi:hypothetical protein